MVIERMSIEIVWTRVTAPRMSRLELCCGLVWTLVNMIACGNAPRRENPKNLPVLQYFGKWPFKAVLGIQEPASVLASLGNLLAHLTGILHFNRSNATFMSNYYRISAVLAVIAWMVAMTFHARDRWWTERADYYTGSIMFFWSVAYTVVRVFKLQNSAIAVVSLLMYFLYRHLS